jgi:hypothetical protein
LSAPCRVLEDELDPPSILRQSSGARSDGFALETDHAGLRFFQTHDRAGQCGLAAARLSGQRKDLAGLDREVHAVDRSRQAAAARKQRLRPDEGDLSAHDLEQMLAHDDTSSEVVAPAPAPSTSRQAEARPSCDRARIGIVVGQGPKASAQRG